MLPETDRTVHVTIVPAVGSGVIEIVRYNRAGKCWYESGKKRRPLTLAAAVEFAQDRRSVIWHEGLPGGAAFDSRVRKMREALS